MLGSNTELKVFERYNSSKPLTTSVALGLLAKLQARLTSGQLRVRARLFVQAARWIRNVASVAGTRSQRGFYNKQDNRIRVDINNFAGLNFRYDEWYLAM